MVIPEGLEPPTYRLGICRSILMSYGTTRPLCPKSPQNANYHLLTNYPRGRINRLTCGALDLSMHKEKQAAGEFLQANQLEKIAGVGKIEAEIAELTAELGRL